MSKIITAAAAAALVKDAKALQRIDILPYQRAAGAKYEMVGAGCDPGFACYHGQVLDAHLEHQQLDLPSEVVVRLLPSATMDCTYWH